MHPGVPEVSCLWVLTPSTPKGPVSQILPRAARVPGSSEGGVTLAAVGCTGRASRKTGGRGLQGKVELSGPLPARSQAPCWAPASDMQSGRLSPWN